MGMARAYIALGDHLKIPLFSKGLSELTSRGYGRKQQVVVMAVKKNPKKAIKKSKTVRKKAVARKRRS